MLTKADVRAIIIEILRKDRPYDSSQPPFQISTICDEFAKIARSRGLKFNETCIVCR